MCHRLLRCTKYVPSTWTLSNGKTVLVKTYVKHDLNHAEESTDDDSRTAEEETEDEDVSEMVSVTATSASDNDPTSDWSSGGWSRVKRIKRSYQAYQEIDEAAAAAANGDGLRYNLRPGRQKANMADATDSDSVTDELETSSWQDEDEDEDADWSGGNKESALRDARDRLNQRLEDVKGNSESQTTSTDGITTEDSDIQEVRFDGKEIVRVKRKRGRPLKKITPNGHAMPLSRPRKYPRVSEVDDGEKLNGRTPESANGPKLNATCDKVRDKFKASPVKCSKSAISTKTSENIDMLPASSATVKAPKPSVNQKVAKSASSETLTDKQSANVPVTASTHGVVELKHKPAILKSKNSTASHVNAPSLAAKPLKYTPSSHSFQMAYLNSIHKKAKQGLSSKPGKNPSVRPKIPGKNGTRGTGTKKAVVNVSAKSQTQQGDSLSDASKSNSTCAKVASQSASTAPGKESEAGPSQISFALDSQQRQITQLPQEQISMPVSSPGAQPVKESAASRHAISQVVQLQSSPVVPTVDEASTSGDSNSKPGSRVSPKSSVSSTIAKLSSSLSHNESTGGIIPNVSSRPCPSKLSLTHLTPIGAAANSQNTTTTTPSLAPPPSPGQVRKLTISSATTADLFLTWYPGSNNQVTIKHNGRTFALPVDKLPEGLRQRMTGIGSPRSTPSSSPNRNSVPASPNRNFVPSSSNWNFVPSSPNRNLVSSSPNWNLVPSSPNRNLVPSAPNRNLVPSSPNRNLVSSSGVLAQSPKQHGNLQQVPPAETHLMASIISDNSQVQHNISNVQTTPLNASPSPSFTVCNNQGLSSSSSSASTTTLGNGGQPYRTVISVSGVQGVTPNHVQMATSMAGLSSNQNNVNVQNGVSVLQGITRTELVSSQNTVQILSPANTVAGQAIQLLPVVPANTQAILAPSQAVVVSDSLPLGAPRSNQTIVVPIGNQTIVAPIVVGANNQIVVSSNAHHQSALTSNNQTAMVPSAQLVMTTNAQTAVAPNSTMVPSAQIIVNPNTLAQANSSNAPALNSNTTYAHQTVGNNQPNVQIGQPIRVVYQNASKPTTTGTHVQPSQQQPQPASGSYTSQRFSPLKSTSRTPRQQQTNPQQQQQSGNVKSVSRGRRSVTMKPKRTAATATTADVNGIHNKQVCV